MLKFRDALWQGSEAGLALNGRSMKRYLYPCPFLALLLLAVLAIPSKAEDLTFRIPPARIPVTIENQPLVVIASGVISIKTQEHGGFLLKLELTADLSSLQQNLTAILGSELNKDDRCGDRIAIQNASLIPAQPSMQAVVQLHYEHYTCVKVFGKQKAQKLVAGNGTIQMKFTPAVEGNEALRLAAEVESIQADGSLGELLRSGPLGNMLREKLKNAILSAMQRGTDRALTVPPAAQNIAAIDRAEFQDSGSGNLGLVLDGEAHISETQVEALKSQLKERLPTR